MLLGKPDVGEDADNAARAAPSTGYMHVCYIAHGTWRSTTN
jgi:hypothetical protein